MPKHSAGGLYVRPQEHICEKMHALMKLAHAENIFSLNLQAQLQPLSNLGESEYVEAVKSQTLSQEYKRLVRRQENSKQIRVRNNAINASLRSRRLDLNNRDKPGVRS